MTQPLKVKKINYMNEIAKYHLIDIQHLLALSILVTLTAHGEVPNVVSNFDG